jgi:transposase
MENELDHINLINTLKERINLLEEKVVELTGALQEKDYNLLYTKEELEKLRRILFGSRSESFKNEGNFVHPTLGFDFGETKEVLEPKTETESEIITYQRIKAIEKDKQITVNCRMPLPAHLPRIKEVIEPEGDLKGAVKIREEITEILEYKTGELYVRQIVRPVYAFPGRDEQPVVIADMPSLPIPKGIAGATLIAWILVCKFVDHLPFYRIAKIFRRDGIKISESTINDWFKSACILLVILYDRLVEVVRSQDYLQVDETTIRVLDRNKPGTTHQGYHWGYHAPMLKLICFHYEKGRGREGPERFLKKFRGTLQTDGYAGYNSFEKPGKITLISCLAHIRRKYKEAMDNDTPRATYVLQKIQLLYAIERECELLNLDFNAIKHMRQQKAVPILQELEKWLKENKPQVLPKSAIGKAIDYTLNLWERQKRYVNDGRYKIDNNLIENHMRPIALARKNFLFAGCHEAAQNGAILFSLFGCCLKNNVNPYHWLVDVLNRLPDCKKSELDDLLPHKWKPLFNNQPVFESTLS